MMRRAQSSVIGVAILLAVTVVSLSVLTVAIGSVVDEGASEAATRDVAASMTDALDTERSGPHADRLALYGGRLRTVDRSLRVLDGSTPVFERSVGGLVFTTADRDVRHVAGATVRDVGDAATFYTPPPFARRNGTLFVDVPALGAPAVAVDGADAVTLRTDVTHDRRRLSGQGFAVAIETRTPAVWERWFADAGATTTRRSFDDDEVVSVVAQFPDIRTAHVFVHDLRLEVGR